MVSVHVCAVYLFNERNVEPLPHVPQMTDNLWTVPIGFFSSPEPKAHW